MAVTGIRTEEKKTDTKRVIRKPGEGMVSFFARQKARRKAIKSQAKEQRQAKTTKALSQVAHENQLKALESARSQPKMMTPVSNARVTVRKASKVVSTPKQTTPVEVRSVKVPVGHTPAAASKTPAKPQPRTEAKPRAVGPTVPQIVTGAVLGGTAAGMVALREKAIKKGQNQPALKKQTKKVRVKRAVKATTTPKDVTETAAPVREGSPPPKRNVNISEPEKQVKATAPKEPKTKINRIPPSPQERGYHTEEGGKKYKFVYEQSKEKPTGGFRKVEVQPDASSAKRAVESPTVGGVDKTVVSRSVRAPKAETKTTVIRRSVKLPTKESSPLPTPSTPPPSTRIVRTATKGVPLPARAKPAQTTVPAAQRKVELKAAQAEQSGAATRKGPGRAQTTKIRRSVETPAATKASTVKVPEVESAAAKPEDYAAEAKRARISRVSPPKSEAPVSVAQTYEVKSREANIAERKAAIEAHIKKKGMTKVTVDEAGKVQTQVVKPKEIKPPAPLKQLEEKVVSKARSVARKARSDLPEGVTVDEVSGLLRIPGRVPSPTMSTTQRVLWNQLIRKGARGAKVVAPILLAGGIAERASAAPRGKKVKAARSSAKETAETLAALGVLSKVAPAAARGLGRVALPLAATVGAIDTARAAYQGYGAFKAARERARVKKYAKEKYGTVARATETRHRRQKKKEKK